MPLGTVQRGSFETAPPRSHQNAYVGSTVQPNGYSTGAGLQRNAIVKVELDLTDTSAFYGTTGIVYGTTNAEAGIQATAITGMIRWGDRNSVSASIVADELADDTLHDLGTINVADLNIPAAASAGATANDWVPFRIELGTIGRRQTQTLTGPDGEGDASSEEQFVAFNISVAGSEMPFTQSPFTSVILPEYTLPTPTSGGPGGLTITFEGAIEVTIASSNPQTQNNQTETVRIYDNDPLNDDLLASVDVILTHPLGAWNGLLIGYLSTAVLFLDVNGHIAGIDGSSGETEAEIYQYVVSNSESSDAISVS